MLKWLNEEAFLTVVQLRPHVCFCTYGCCEMIFIALLCCGTSPKGTSSAMAGLAVRIYIRALTH